MKNIENTTTSSPQIPVACYVRCSNINHIDDSIENQLGEINKYAENNNMNIVATYIDLPRREKKKYIERDRMFEDAESNPSWQKILFFSFDRITRNLHFFHTHYKHLQELGIELIGVTQPSNNFNKGCELAIVIDKILSEIN